MAVAVAEVTSSEGYHRRRTSIHPLHHDDCHRVHHQLPLVPEVVLAVPAVVAVVVEVAVAQALAPARPRLPPSPWPTSCPWRTPSSSHRRH